MEINYTDFNRNSITEFSSNDDIDRAVDFLKNPDSFRSFDKGLKQILIQKGFRGDTNNDYELAEHLISKLKNIGSETEDATVYSWLAGTPEKAANPRPKIEAGSRLKIYEICFALDLSFEETVWFFEHVYYDRPFNCRTISEAVFYYAFRHHMSYKDARALIEEIDALPSAPRSSCPEANYTRFVQKQISGFGSVDELRKFLADNKDNFSFWNQSALAALKLLTSQLIAPPAAKDDIKEFKRMLARKIKASSRTLIDVSGYRHCGLLLQEIIYDARIQTYETAAEYISEAIKDKNISANTFILERLLSSSAGLKKNPVIPYVVRNNFPSKKTFSNVLSADKISTSQSYDAIRKVIILLDFYRYWVTVKLKENPWKLSQKELAKIYREEADDRLYHCGYNELYDGNPYDWIYLCSAQSDDPLEYFRSCAAELLPDD